MDKLFNRKFAERLIMLIGMVSLAFFINLKDLSIDYRFENFFPAKDPDLQFYYDFTEEFETDNDFFIIGIKNEEGIFKQAFLQKADSLTDTLANIKHATSITSPTRLKFPVAGPMGGFISVPYLHPGQPDKFSTDSARIYKSKNLVGSMFSEDGKSLSIQLKHEPGLGKKANDSLVATVVQTVENFSFDEAHVAGKIYGQYYFTRQLFSEIFIFISISILLVAVFLYFSFESLWGVWVPMVVIGLSVLWMLSILGFIEEPINLMTTLLPTILFVVGISNVVHILERYIYELRSKKTKIKAIKIAFKEVGFATFLTSFTTAVGFFTLNTINVVPVKEFGTYTAIGVLITFVLAFTLLPSVLVIARKPKVTRKDKDTLFWNRKLHALLKWILPNRKKLAAALLGVILLSLFGIYYLRVDNSLIEDWTVNEETKQDYLFFEREFSGFRPLEIAVWVADSASGQELTNFNAIQQLDVIEKGIEEIYSSKFIVSPLTFVKAANQSLHGGQPEHYRIPETEAGYKKLQRRFRSYQAQEMSNYLNEAATMARFSGKIQDYGGRRMQVLNSRFDSLMHEQLNKNLVKYKLTGMPVLIDKNNETLSTNLLLGLFIAFSVVALLMGLLFRSFSMIFISLLPNILPLALIAAFMGAASIDLKIATSIIFTIAFGIAVDDTIHFMTKFRLELNKGRTILYALKRTYLQTGKAIIVTSIILCSGFLILMLSQVPSTFYIGLLISLTLLFAVISDLLLLPILIVFFYRAKRK